MEMSTWLALVGVCLLLVSLGLWVVSQIFPSDHARTPGSEPHGDPHQESSRA